MSDLSIQNRMIGIIGTVGVGAGMVKRAQEKQESKAYREERDKIHDEQTNARIRQKDEQLAQAERKQDFAENQAKTKHQEFEENLHLKKYQTDLHNVERQQSNLNQANTNIIRNKKVDSEILMNQAKARFMDTKTAIMQAKAKAEQNAVSSQQDIQQTNQNQKMGVSDLLNTIRNNPSKFTSEVYNPVKD